MGVRRWARRHQGPLVVVGCFVVLPALLFGLPAALGLTWLVGDNLIQNFPLRVLVGTDLAHGHLALWDPYVWSGSPLLAGFNAGAAYPLTALFAVLPHVLAWVANQVLSQVVVALGLVTFLRLQGRSWAASAVGAGSFAYGGFVAMQDLHLDLVQAAGWLVWAFVALDRLARRPPGRSALPWVSLLGVSLGLMALSGAAEPLLDGAVALGLYLLWLLYDGRGRRLSIALGTMGGGALGALIGAAQLVPGQVLQSQSQRSLHTYAYFTSGSVNKSFTVLGLDPLVLGGAHTFPMPFAGTYNLPEISSYIGILAPMAMVGLLARRHRQHPEARRLWVWYAMAAVGLVLAWGSFTPLGHLEYLVPLYNRQRLLGRNLLEVDLAAAVLLAAWLDLMLLARRPAPGSTPRRRPRLLGWAPASWTSDVVLALLPVLGVVGLQVTLLVGGPWFFHFLHVPAPVTWSSVRHLGLWMTVPTAVALAAGWLVVRGAAPRRQAAIKARWVVLLVLVDLAVFNAGAQITPQHPNASQSASALARSLASAVAADGQGAAGGEHRMALFDPDRFYPNQVDALGQPDLNVLRGLRSVQGYGAIVGGAYDAATATHLQGNVALGALAGATSAGLDLGVLITVPQYFVHLEVAAPGAPASIISGATPIPPVGPTGAPGGRSPAVGAQAVASTVVEGSTAPVPSTSAVTYGLTAPPAATVTLAPGSERTFFFGATLDLRALDVPLRSGGPRVAPPVLRVGLLSPDGRSTRWLQGPAGTFVLPDAATSALQLALPRPASAAGLVLSVPPGATPVTVADVVLDTAGQGVYRLDGSLRDVVRAPRWHYAGRIGVFCVFTQAKASGLAWTLSVGPSSARIVSDAPWGTEVVRVHSTTGAVLVRDEAYDAGWQATVAPVVGERGVSAPALVLRYGVVQAVAVPAGTQLVTFEYRPAKVDAALAAGVLGVALAVVLVVVGRRRQRPARA
ncbi:MAG TPA: hypothetical protein VMV14_01060 [Acidimicrobiales bacterium]|nr:hypothetical protein [Acidimicrobiales bacterium]